MHCGSSNWSCLLSCPAGATGRSVTFTKAKLWQDYPGVQLNAWKVGAWPDKLHGLHPSEVAGDEEVALLALTCAMPCRLLNHAE